MQGSVTKFNAMKEELQILELLSLLKDNLESGSVLHTTYFLKLYGENIEVEIRIAPTNFPSIPIHAN